MKVNDPNLPSLASIGAARTQETGRAGQTNQPANSTGATTASGDDVHLSELVSSLRSLAADSPDRQAQIEQLARTYASGSYQVDAAATASKMIDDALKPS